MLQSTTATNAAMAALLYSERLALHKHRAPWVWNGHAVGVCFRFQGNVKLWVFSIYVPTSPRTAGEAETAHLWTALSRKLQKITAKPNRYVVLLGDFNATLNPSIDRSSDGLATPHTATEPETPMLQGLLARGYVDAYRLLHPFETRNHYTFASHNRKSKARLDLCLTSSTLATSVMQSDVVFDDDIAAINSSHGALVTDISTVVWCDRWARTKATQLMRNRAQRAYDSTLLINTRAPADKWLDFRNRSDLAVTPDMCRTADNVRAGLGSPATRLARVEHLGLELTENLTKLAKETLGTRRRTLRRKPQASRNTRSRCQNLGMIVATHRQHLKTEPRSQHAIERAQRILQPSDPLYPPANAATDNDRYDEWLANLRMELSTERSLAKRQAAQAKREIIQAAQQKRCEDLFSNLSGFVKNAMSRPRDRVQIDRVSVVNEESGVPLQEYSGDPTVILSKTKEVFSNWTSPRNPQVATLLQDPFWQQIYQPRQDIAEDVWEPLLQPVTPKELASILHAVAGGKSPGPSQLSYDLLRNADPAVTDTLLAVVNEVIQLSDMPSSWLQHDICPIPKKGWNGDINRTRPIALVEVLRKVVEKVINTRLAVILESRGVLHGGNAGFMPKSGLDELLWMLRGTLDDAREQKRELWLVLLDIQRAYDHVSWEGVEPALERIRAPPGFITLLRNMWSKRSARVHTAVGTTEWFKVHIGLAQGAVLSPLLWNIFYDPLLTALKTVQGYRISPSVSITHSAFADDTQIVGESKQAITAMLRLAAPFFELQDVRLHPDKFEVFAFHAPPEDTQHGLEIPTATAAIGPTVPINVDPKQGFTILGATMALNDSGANQLAKIKTALSAACVSLAHKALTDKQIAYLVKRVIQPSIQHTLKATLHSATVCNEIDRQLRAVVRSKSGLPNSVGNWLLYSLEIYAYATMMDLQAEVAISSLFYCLNSPGHVRDFAVARLHSVAEQDQLGFLPHARPSTAIASSCDYLRTTIGYMQNDGAPSSPMCCPPVAGRRSQ